MPTGPEDLWLLFNFVQPGDRVVARTSRVFRVGSEEKSEKIRKPMTVRIVISKKSLDLPSSKLNLTGTVELAPENAEGVKGRSHTIAIEPGKKVAVLKAAEDPVAWELLKRARGSQRKVIILAMEYGNAAIGVFSDSGSLETQEVQHNISGKENLEERRKDIVDFFKRVASTLEELVNRTGAQIALVGPGFAKDDFMVYLERSNPALRSKIAHLGSSTSGTAAGVMEAVKSGTLTKFLRDLRFSQESLLVEEVLKRLGKEPGTVALGLTEVSQSSASGAVGHLLVLESVFQEVSVDPRELESILRSVQKSDGEVTFVSPRHEGGQKLKSLGCIAALLRYPFFQRGSR